MAELDKPKNKMIVAMVFGTIAALAIIVLLVAKYFDMTLREEIEKKVYAHEASSLRDLHAKETAKLTTYQWVDKAKGVVRIPVDRALQLTLKDWDSRPAGLVEPEKLPAPAPAPAASAPASAPAASAPTPESAPASKPAGTP